MNRLGALVERDFRLLFLATVTTPFGDMVAVVALRSEVVGTGGAAA